jgi:hypothetical protein
MCAKLMAPRPRFLLLTSHTPGFGPDRLLAMVSDAMNVVGPGRVSAQVLQLHSATGRDLACGSAVRWLLGDAAVDNLLT